jgi:hypothetical protein
MASDGTRSLQDIRRETERTRSGLTHSVTELRGAVTDTASDIREKLRPEAIKSEVAGYIKGRREELVHTLTEAARRNPMQAVAVGASIAYPLMRIARSIPLPVLMIGAGLFFAGSTKGRDLTQQASNVAGDLADEARRRAHDLSDQMAQAASEARDYATESAAQIKGSVITAVEQSRHTVGAAMEGIRDQTGSAAQRVRDAASSTGASISSQTGGARNAAAGMTDKLKTEASQAAASIRDTAVDAAEAGQDYATLTRERLAEAGSTTRRTMQETVEQNPLLMAGVGVLIGGLIASVMPKFELEDDLMGDASDQLRKRAHEAASDTFDSAKNAAGEILTDVAQKAEEEGLTTDGLMKGVQDVGERLQRVAERGITTAFEPEGSGDLQSQTQGGGKENG